MLTDSTGCVQRHYAQRLTGIVLCIALVEGFMYVFIPVGDIFISQRFSPSVRANC